MVLEYCKYLAILGREGVLGLGPRERPADHLGKNATSPEAPRSGAPRPEGRPASGASPRGVGTPTAPPAGRGGACRPEMKRQ